MVKKIISICAAGMIVASCSPKKTTAQPTDPSTTDSELTMLVGTYTSGNSKGIYTFLTLPMKGTQVANAFLLQSLAMVFLYYALWLMVIVIMYFPMMHWMVSLAAKQEFLMNDGSILTGIDATRHNGLFLAFLRSEFLSIAYSLDWKNMMCALFLLFFAGVWIVSVSMQRAIGLTGIFICAAGLMIPLALYLQGHSAGEMSNILLTGSILLLAVGVWLIFRLQADFREPLAK